MRVSAGLGWLGLLVLSVQLLSSAEAAFLQNQLPLEVVLTTPSQLLDNATKSITVSERQAFLAVFSRPVIALGSDFGKEQLPTALVPFKVNCPVPGLFHWVTTNIARWDPAISWPTDLDCEITWNTDLKTFDGAPLVLNSPKSIKIKSAPISMTVASIASASANNATDDQWSAYRGMSDDHFPEVPPDANITLLFSYPVLLSALQAALAVVPCCGSNAGASQTVKVLPCGPPYVVVDPFASPDQQLQQQQNSTCAIVRITPGLAPSGTAILRLPKGARYNTVSGPTTNDTDVYLWGLRRFRIPLRDNFQQLASASEQFQYLDNGISYRRLLMWLPHGTAPGVTTDTLKKQMYLCKYRDPYNWETLCDQVQFELERVNKGQLLLTVPTLAVRQHYQFKVSGNPSIKDAYGLPLEDSYAWFFTTEPAADLSYPELASGAPVMLLEPDYQSKPLPWPVVYRGKPGYDWDPQGVSVWPLELKPHTGVRVLSGDSSPASVVTLGKPVTSFTRTYSSVTSTKMLYLSGKPGVQLVGTPANSTYDALPNKIMVVQSDLQYAAILTGTRITHFVTLTTPKATPLSGAKVSLSLYPCCGDAPKAGPTCTTAADGSCTVELRALLDGSYGTLSAVVEASGHGPLVIHSISTPSYYEDESLQFPYVGDLVVDRLVVFPGDKLHITGYVQERTGMSSRLSLPSGLQTVNVTVMPNFKGTSDSDPLTLPVQLNTLYGSFHLVVPVPADAKPGEYSINLKVPKTKPGAVSKLSGSTDDNSASIASVSVQVGNPRPPTAFLNVTVPDWSPPNSTVKVLFKASSYLGADVGGAIVQVSWTVPDATGNFNITTDAKGQAQAEIPLGKLPPQNATSLGDQLSITAVWIGPTRERITQTASVRLANGPVRVELTRSPNTDVPGVPFVMSAASWINDKDSTRIEGVTVEVSLKPNASDSLVNCSKDAASLVFSQKCQLVSGKPLTKPCMITLPCAADWKLVACALTYPNGSKVLGYNGQPACSETPIGRNDTAWEMSPWSVLPQLGLLNDRQNYTVGSMAVLSFVNSYWRSATGMLVWGNARLQKQKALSDVPVGPNSVSIQLGEECLGGCKAQLILSLPRPSAAESAAVGPKITPLQLKVPKGKLFNPLAPATASASVTLNVLEDNRLNVTVKVIPAADSTASALPQGVFKNSAVGVSGQIVPVMKSGADANIEVKVTDALTGQPAVDAEVTVLVVDESILALLPYPLPDIASDLVAYPSVQAYIKEINEYRTTRSNINTTFSTLERRLALDPWLPLVTTVTPSTSIDYAAWGYRATYPIASVVDVPDAKYLRGFTNPLTVTPFYTWGLSQRYPSGSQGNAGPAAELRLSSQFETVPVFTIIHTKTDGSSTVKFKAPPNLGTFNVRAYAVTKGSTDKPSKFGANETQVIVRRPISLTASVPQSVRVGDDFEAGVLVSSPDAAKAVTVEVKAQMVAPSSAEDASNSTSAKEALATGDSLVLLPTDPVLQTITLSPQQQQVEVRFRYQAKSIGASGLRFDARVPDINSADAADATQQDVSVLGQQGAVFLATSFSLQAGGDAPGSKGRQEGLELPDATPGSGSVDLLAGVGYLPAIKATYDSLVQRQAAAASNSDNYTPWGPDAVSTALLPAFLARYSSSTATMLASANSSKPGSTPLVTLSQLNASAAAAKAVSTKLTKPDLGLMYYVPPGGVDSYFASPSVQLNSWALWLTGQVQQTTLPGLAFGSSLKEAASTWKSAVELELLKNAKEARNPPAPVNQAYKPEYVPLKMYMDFEELSWARLALGADWAPKDVSKEVTSDLSLPRLVLAATTPNNCSLGTQARTGLILAEVVKQNGKSTSGLTVSEAKSGMDKLTKLMLGNVRVSGRTAYLTSDPGSASAASPQQQAFALAFLTQQDLPAAKEILPKLAAYVSGGKASIASSTAAASCVSVGGTSSGTVAAALSSYDAKKGSTSPDATLTVTAVSGNASSSITSSSAKKLLSAAFTPATAGALVNSATPWSALPASPQLRFEVQGKSGEVSIAAGLEFTPAKLLPFPSYRGLWVERVIQTEAGTGNLLAAALADVVTVTVQLTTPDDLSSGVVLEVQMPGGLEPIDPAIYKDDAAATQCDFGDSYRWWCPAQATLRSVVTFTFGYLGAGTVNIKFKATAATPGTFVLPPVKAYSVAEPELMGLSAAGEFTVCPNRRGANAAATTAGVAKTKGAAAFAVCSSGGAMQKALPAAKSCPGNCNANGVCNLLTGACLCNSGFLGASCNVYNTAAV